MFICFFILRSYDVFTVDSTAAANNWAAGHNIPSRPLTTGPTAAAPTLPSAATNGEEGETKEQRSPPPPYKAAVYDPNATNELEEWEEKNF